MLAFAGVLVLALLTGCTSVAGTGDRGYILGNGQVSLVDAADRGKPIDLDGTTLDGKPLSIADLRGKPTVINVWWSQCGPCRAEAPDLVSAYDKIGKNASFVGLNIRDTSADQGLDFEREHDVPYPSIYDPDGAAILAFAGHVRLSAPPSTVVLDDQGRVAGVISGAIPSVRTLVDLVDEVSTDG